MIAAGVGTFMALSWDNATQMAAASSVPDRIARNIEVVIYLTVM
jgi:hypothetical protein